MRQPRARLVALLLVIASACSPWPVAGTPAQSPLTVVPTPTPVGGITPTALPTELPTTVPTQVPVNLQLSYTANGKATIDPGLYCPNWGDRSDQLVLAEPRLTYSPTEIQQIATVVQGVLRYDRVAGTPLRLVPGVPTTPDGGYPTAQSSIPQFGCDVRLELANLGSTTVEVDSVGFQYTSASEDNPTLYPLIEACSVQKSIGSCAPGQGGVPDVCSVYGVNVKLRAGPAGSQFFGQPSATDLTGNPCPTIILAPRATITLAVEASSPDPMLDHTVPALDVLTPSGRQVVTFPQLPGIAAFADPSAFTCYRLEGTTFVAWKQGLAALDWGALFSENAWCP
jgi:hypothetical protein